jgi:hypothetical protein
VQDHIPRTSRGSGPVRSSLSVVELEGDDSDRVNPGCCGLGRAVSALGLAAEREIELDIVVRRGSMNQNTRPKLTVDRPQRSVQSRTTFSEGCILRVKVCQDVLVLLWADLEGCNDCSPLK